MLLDYVSVASFSVLAGLISDKYILIPVLVSVAFPAFPTEAAFAAFGVILFYGVVVKIFKIGVN